jgi:hypothetical protein
MRSGNAAFDGLLCFMESPFQPIEAKSLHQGEFIQAARLFQSRTNWHGKHPALS